MNVFQAENIFSNFQFDEVDYDENAPDDVSPDHAWGYCDQMCHARGRDLKPKVLQEVKGKHKET